MYGENAVEGDAAVWLEPPQPPSSPADDSASAAPRTAARVAFLPYSRWERPAGIAKGSQRLAYHAIAAREFRPAVRG
jgi:hypothetical protein